MRVQDQRPQADKRERGADEVQATAGRVAMLVQVVRVELGEAVQRFRVAVEYCVGHRLSLVVAGLASGRDGLTIAFNTASGASCISACPEATCATVARSTLASSFVALAGVITSRVPTIKSLARDARRRLESVRVSIAHAEVVREQIAALRSRPCCMRCINALAPPCSHAPGPGYDGLPARPECENALTIAIARAGSSRAVASSASLTFIG